MALCMIKVTKSTFVLKLFVLPLMLRDVELQLMLGDLGSIVIFCCCYFQFCA